MAVRLTQTNGDSLAVPQLLLAKLPEAQGDWVRVALFILSTGDTDPERIARSLRLKSPEKAREALLYWQGAGLLEVCENEQCTCDLTAKPARARKRMTTREVTSAAVGDPAIMTLVQESQRLTGGVVNETDQNIFVTLYRDDGVPVEVILLCIAHFTALGKRNARYIERAILTWQSEGIATAEAVEAHLQRLARHEEFEKEVAALLRMPCATFTKSENSLIASWYEDFGYGGAMIAEAIACAGDKQTVRYLNGILRAWHGKGYKTVRDVMRENADTMRNIQSPAPTANPYKKDVLMNGLRPAPTFKKED